MMCFGNWTQGGRMEGANESTELWRHSIMKIIFAIQLLAIKFLSLNAEIFLQD